jgi:hypothetical protein
VPAEGPDEHGDGPCAECAGRLGAPAAPPDRATAGYTIRQANALSDHIRVQTLRSLNDPTVQPTRYVDTDFFAKQLEYRVVQSPRGRRLLAEPASTCLPKKAAAKLAKHLGQDLRSLEVRDVWSLRCSEIASATGLDPETIRRARLGSLGVAFHDERPESTEPPTSGPSKPRPSRAS